jgi:Zn-dependent peptidase ImmA (M78 family)/DNA-binding XRE family transcriptional regulator
MNDLTALGERLRYARERAGLTQGQVRDRAGIGESSLSEFEHGKREPNLSQLAALARAYRRPASFFLSQGSLPREVVRWRQRPREGAEEVEVRFLRLGEQYANLETWCDARAAVALPTPSKPEHPFDRRDAEALASRVRRDLALGEYPATLLHRTLEEQCGLKVFHLDFEPTGTAACTMNPGFGAAVLLNAKNPRWRRNFDLAHELFHLLTWDFLEPTAPADEAWTKDEEKLADTFAASLLMPADIVREAVSARLRDRKLSLPALFEIARQFDVSAEALLWRIHGLYGGTPANKAVTEAMIQRARDAARIFDDREQEPPPVRPARFVALAVAALRGGELSIGRFAEYVGKTRQQAMAYVEQEPGDDEALEFPAA